MHPKFNINRERDNKIYYCEYENDYCLFHFHSQIELYFVDSGSMEMFVAGKSKSLAAGEMCISLSNDAHAYKTPDKSSSSVFIIPTEIASTFISEIGGCRLESPYITDKKTVLQIKDYINAVNKSKNNTESIGYINLILGKILEVSKLCSSEGMRDSELSTRIFFYIEENYKNKITPGDVAKHFGYSQGYISRYFKSEMGITLTEYLNLVRLKFAAEQIINGGSVTTAAFDSGFGSTRAFYRAFAKEFKCAPKEYAEKTKK